MKVFNYSIVYLMALFAFLLADHWLVDPLLQQGQGFVLQPTAAQKLSFAIQPFVVDTPAPQQDNSRALRRAAPDGIPVRPTKAYGRLP
jgi:hypothetical protein